LNALRAEGYVQANGRLQRWSKGSQQGLVEAASKDLEGFRGLRGLKGLNAGKRQVEAAAKDVKGFRGLKGLKAGKRHAI